jgi:hypothetical protein
MLKNPKKIRYSPFPDAMNLYQYLNEYIILSILKVKYDLYNTSGASSLLLTNSSSSTSSSSSSSSLILTAREIRLWEHCSLIINNFTGGSYLKYQFFPTITSPQISLQTLINEKSSNKDKEKVVEKEKEKVLVEKKGKKLVIQSILLWQVMKGVHYLVSNDSV